MPSKFLSGLFLCVLVGVVAFGCAWRVQKYEMRGVVLRLPDASSPQLVVLHEAVENFKSEQGERSRMDVMMMGFAVDPSVDLKEIEVQDKLRVKVKVDWRKMPSMLVTSVSKLPAETKLELDGYSVEPMVS